MSSNYDVEPMWFEKPLRGLPPEAEKKMNYSTDRVWLRYANAFKTMTIRAPLEFYKKTDARDLYKKLIEFCERQFLPEDLALRLVTPLIKYMKEGRWRPMIFIGPPGCGKSTTARMVMERILGLGVTIKSAPLADTSHGLAGETSVFSGGGMGILAEGMITNDSLVNGYVIDEIDSAPEPTNRSSLTNELLTLCDDGAKEFCDNFLGFKLVGLVHSPLIMTANDETKVNAILLDRCIIIRFKAPTVSQLQKIILEYAKKEIKNEPFNMIEIDTDALNASVEALAKSNVTSIRRHQDMLEQALSSAFREAIEKDLENVRLSRKFFDEARALIQKSNEGRKIGFDM